MKDVMIDFETFGQGPTAVVVQVGAAFFNRETGEVGATYKSNIDARSYMGRGFGKIDPDTIYWWLTREQNARESIAAGGRDVREVFTELNEFLGRASCIWSHATFDFPILSEALKALKIAPTFRYWSARDIRTVIDLSGYDTKNHPEVVFITTRSTIVNTKLIT